MVIQIPLINLKQVFSKYKLLARRQYLKPFQTSNPQEKYTQLNN